jgi:xanthine/CO dehydrogenase XdhC/CoxF family maturation factor
MIDEPEGGALVTITRTKGSTYRREGAKMLCLQDGSMLGSISGGCLESDAYEVSLEVVERNEPQMVFYDTSAEDENVWGLGLGCNGSVEVLIEPMAWWRSGDGRNLFDQMMRRVDRGDRCAVVTVLAKDSERQTSLRRMIVDPDGQTTGTLGSRGLDSVAAHRAQTIVTDETVRPSRKITVESDSSVYEIFVDALLPPTRLLVAGGGHDAIPMVKLAREIGLVVTLIDSRSKFASHDRFPDADQVICTPPEEFSQRVSLEGCPAVILMNHHYLKDRTILGQLLTSSLEMTYIGALGPRVRTEKMISDLQEQGLKLVKEKVHAVRTPIGLDIGADSPEEIAISVLSELLAVKNKRSGLPLRERNKAIHQAA